MNAMIVLRLDGEDGFQLVDPNSGSIRPMESRQDASATDDKRTPGVAAAYALPALPSIPSRKFYRH